MSDTQRGNGPDFTGAKMDGAQFFGMDLSDAKGLTQEQIDGAYFDENSTLPAGLHARNVLSQEDMRRAELRMHEALAGLHRGQHFTWGELMNPTKEVNGRPLAWWDMHARRWRRGNDEPWYEDAVREGRISESTYYLSVAQDAWLRNHARKQHEPSPDMDDGDWLGKMYLSLMVGFVLGMFLIFIVDTFVR